MLPSKLPSPRLIPADSVRPLRWGIIGPGMIAEVFTDATHQHTNQRVVAVASQTPGRAEAFAEPRGIEVALDSYEALVARPDVDVVYVATHPQHHRAHAELAIAAGKHVLIEKPLAPTAEDAQAIADDSAASALLAEKWASQITFPVADTRWSAREYANQAKSTADSMVNNIGLSRVDGGDAMTTVFATTIDGGGAASVFTGAINCGNAI